MAKKTIGAELVEAMKDALAFTKGKRVGYRVHTALTTCEWSAPI